MVSEGASNKDPNFISSYVEATQLLHRLRKKYEHLGMGERHGCIVEEIKKLEIPEEMRSRLLREFG